MASSSARSKQFCDGQAGVSLVEIVVAMFILAIMSVAILPLTIGAVQASAMNRDLLAADTLANTQLATLQNDFPETSPGNSCALVLARKASNIPDPSGSTVTGSITFTPAECPSTLTSYPITLRVTVQSFRASNPTRAVVTIDSAILVSAA
jgi:prepilin-type N-terminal cleavage/methylation domain-containing protein